MDAWGEIEDSVAKICHFVIIDVIKTQFSPNSPWRHKGDRSSSWWLYYGTWHGKLNFFRKRPCGKSAYIRADNQRIPCGTISKFYSYNDISNDPCGVFLDLLALLRTKFAFWFLPFSNRIHTEDSCPSVRKIRARPCGRSASARTEVPWHLCGKSASFRAEQLRNSSEKVKFSVSCTVYRFWWTTTWQNQSINQRQLIPGSFGHVGLQQLHKTEDTAVWDELYSKF